KKRAEEQARPATRGRELFAQRWQNQESYGRPRRRDSRGCQAESRLTPRAAAKIQPVGDDEASSAQACAERIRPLLLATLRVAQNISLPLSCNFLRAPPLR